MGEYYKFDSKVLHFDKGHYHAFNSKTISSGTGNVEIFRFTPGCFNDIPATYLLSINAFAFTDISAGSGSEAGNIKNFRSRVYLVRRPDPGGSVSVIQSVDECVDRDSGQFVEELGTSDPYDYTLSIGRDLNLTRQITIVVDCYLADGNNETSFVTMSDDV